MNTFSSIGSFTGAETCAYERARMLNGQAAGMQCFNTTTAYGAILPGDLDGTTAPPVGAADMQIGLGRDNSHLASFAFHVDWSPGYPGTTLTETDVAVAPYSGACGGGGVCIPQLGTTQLLDSLADRVMYRYAYRNLGDHESWVVNYSVDVNGVSEPRWFELRRTPPATGGPLAVFQDSTFAPDSNHRWMGSVAMDQGGDIALGYSESSAAMKPAIAYTGRQPTDPLNTMEPETILLAGAGAQTGGLNRWGDYSAMSVDPSDGCTFWYTNQYIPSDGSFNWATRIGSFAFPDCTPRTDSDFSMALLPVSGIAVLGGAITATVSTGRTAGTAQSIALSAAGLPSGVSATFSPASVVAGPGPGSSSTMTLTVAPGTAPGTYAISVNGTGSATSHAAIFTLIVPGSGIVNGGFETGDLAGWTTTAGIASVATTAHSGAYGAVVGATTATDGDSTISQPFVLTAPSTVSLWYQMSCPDTVAYDWATVILTDITTGATTSVLPKTCQSSLTWTQVTASLSASSVGHTFTLALTSHDDGNPADPTLTKYDDVAVTPSLSPDFSLSASPASRSVTAGSGTTYTATVGALNGFSGTVALGVSGLPSGATGSFSPGSISASGSSTLSISTAAATPPGTYQLTISGTSGSLSHSTTVSLTVGAAADFSLSASPASRSVTAGSGTSYTATVGALNGFSGTVALGVSGLPSGATGSFSPGSISASGSSTLSISTAAATPPGTYQLTISGTSGSLSHSTTVSLTVGAAADFSLSASPASRSVTAGSGTSYTATVGALNGFSGTVALGVSGLPSGATGSFSPGSISASGSSTLSISTAAATPPGTYQLTISGTSGSLSHSTTVSLTVGAAADFSLSASPASRSVTAGSGTSYTATVGALNGFSGTVALGVSGLPSGATGSFSPGSISASGSSTLSISTAAATPPGTYQLTISGTSGSLSHSTTVSLTVGAAADFSLSASPASRSVRHGRTATYSITVSPTGGFAGSVQLSLAVSPSGPSGSFRPSSLASGTSTLTVSAGQKTGTFTLTITGTSGGLTHSVQVVLVVTKR